jgi:hypothetical protein
MRKLIHRILCLLGLRKRQPITPQGGGPGSTPPPPVTPQGGGPSNTPPPPEGDGP